MIFLGIAGGSGSGKTTLAHRILDHFGNEHCQIISQDNFYKDQSHKFDHDGGAVNFDHPASIDFDLLTKHMQKLCEKKSINCPIYDFATHKRLPETIEVIERDTKPPHLVSSEPEDGGIIPSLDSHVKLTFSG